MKNKFIEYLWYVVVILAIWGSALGGITIPSIGLMSPYRIISVLTLIILLINKIKNDGTIKKDNIKIILLFLFCILYNILLLFSENSMIDSLKKGLNYFYGILLIILAKNFITNNKVYNITINVITINYIIILIISLYESFTGVRFFEVQARQIKSHNSVGLFLPIVAFYNTNGLATFLIMFLPIIYNSSLMNKNKIGIIIKVIIMLLSIFVMYLTESRLACIIFILYVILLIIKNLKDIRKIIFILLSVMTVFILCNTVFVEQIEKIEYDIFGTINEDNDSVNVRANIISNGINSLKESYFLGIGVGNFEKSVANYNETYQLSLSHNFIIELLVENGLIIFSILTLIYIKLFIKILKKIKRETRVEIKNIYYNILFLMAVFPLTTSIHSSSYGFLPMWLMVSIFTIIPNIEAE